MRAKHQSGKRQTPHRRRAAGRRSANEIRQRNALALVYVRTATVDQESAAAQRALKVRARELGWPPKRVRIIKDIGHSGLSDNRPGFRQMMDLLDARGVGLIMVDDVSRISRSAIVLRKFLSKAVHADVLLAVGRRIVDVSNLQPLFPVSILGRTE